MKRKVLDNRVLRNVLETERKGEAGEWRKLHRGKLHGFELFIK
jgi:hypothetical protein